jgi:tape measure domain-containing protein
VDLEYLKVAIDCSIDDFERGIKDAEKGLGRLVGAAQTAGKELTTYLTAPLGLLGVAAIKTSAELEGLERGFAAVYKGAIDVGSEIRKTLEVAKLPGLGLKEALQGSTNLQAAGFSAEQARKTLMAFGNALATVGKGKSELDRVTLALTQINNTSNVTQQDLNQLKQTLPQIGSILQQAFGTTNADGLRKLGITSQQFISTVTTEFAKLPKVTGGLGNALENLSDAGTLALGKLGDSAAKAFNLQGVADTLSNKLTGLAEDFSNLDSGTQKAILGFAGVAAAAGPLLLTVGAIGKALPVAIEGFGLLQKVAIAAYTSFGPVGIAIGVATAALVYFAATAKDADDRFQEVKQTVGDTNDKLMPLIATYDTLKAKTKLTSDEQKTLNETIKEIAVLVPGAATGYDKLGKAMDINIARAKTLIEANKTLLRDAAKQAEPDAAASVNAAKKALEPYQKQINEFNKTGKISIEFNGKFLKFGREDEIEAVRKKQAQLVIELQNGLDKLNEKRQALGKPLLILNDKNIIVESNAFDNAIRAQKEAALNAEKEKNAKILDSRKQLEADIEALNKKKEVIGKGGNEEEIASINILIQKKQEQIKVIDALGVGTKAQQKAALKDQSDLTKAQNAFADGLRKVNNEFRLQGSAYDVAGEKAKVYKTYMDKLIELDKTGKVEQTPNFQAAINEYKRLSEASKQFKIDSDVQDVYLAGEQAILRVQEKIKGLGKYQDDYKEKVKILEGELTQVYNTIESIEKAGGQAGSPFLVALKQQAEDTKKVLENARNELKAAILAADLADFNKIVGEAKPKQGFIQTVGASLTGPFKKGALDGSDVSALEDRINRAQAKLRELEKDGASDGTIKAAKKKIEDLKLALDLADVFTSAKEAAADGIGSIAESIGNGLGAVITGQLSLTDGLRSVLADTLGVLADFMREFGRKLILIGAANLILGNPVGLGQIAAGVALTAGAYVVDFAAGAVKGGQKSGGSSPTSSASTSPSGGVNSQNRQNINIEVTFSPVELRAAGPELRAIMAVDKTRVTNLR